MNREQRRVRMWQEEERRTRRIAKGRSPRGGETGGNGRESEIVSFPLSQPCQFLSVQVSALKLDVGSMSCRCSHSTSAPPLSPPSPSSLGPSGLRNTSTSSESSL